MDNIQHDIVKVIGGKKYSTKTAMLIGLILSTGRGAHLYCTSKGAYFVAHSTIWDGERDTVEVLSVAEAMERYETYEQEVSFEEAFPHAEEVELA